MRIKLKRINSTKKIKIKPTHEGIEGEFAHSLLPRGRPQPKSSCDGRFEAMERSSIDWPEGTKKSSSAS